MADAAEVLRITRLFKASAEALYDAWTRREDWAQWIGPEGIDCKVLEMEPVVGGDYLLRMNLPSGEIVRVRGTYMRLDRPERIEFTWGAADPTTRIETLVTLQFRAAPGGTEMTLTHHGLGTSDNIESHDKGWQSALNKLRRFVEGETK
jgi:uncharacterized protein YndB with AHSA1/START domain